jgi:hypothetical protein
MIPYVRQPSPKSESKSKISYPKKSILRWTKFDNNVPYLLSAVWFNRLQDSSGNICENFQGKYVMLKLLLKMQVTEVKGIQAVRIEFVCLY